MPALGEFSSDLSEIISARTAGSLQIRPVAHHSGGGSVSPPVPDVKGHRYGRPAETLINTAGSWAGEAERRERDTERERERPEETERWRERER